MILAVPPAAQAVSSPLSQLEFYCEGEVVPVFLTQEVLSFSHHVSVSPCVTGVMLMTDDVVSAHVALALAQLAVRGWFTEFSFRLEAKSVDLTGRCLTVTHSLWLQQARWPTLALHPHDLLRSFVKAGMFHVTAVLWVNLLVLQCNNSN